MSGCYVPCLLNPVQLSFLVQCFTNPDQPSLLVPCFTNPEQPSFLVPCLTNPDQPFILVPCLTNKDQTSLLVPCLSNPEASFLVPCFSNPDQTSLLVPCLTNPDQPSFLVPCLPNPEQLSFLTFVGFIEIFLSAFWIILRLSFHIKQPMNYHKQSPYHHQPFQSIINQQSLPTYLLDAFCNHWDFCSLLCLLQHLDSHQSPSTISSAIHCLNLFQSSPNFHRILECTSHTPDDTFLSMILVLLLALLHSSLTSLTMSNAAFLSEISLRSMK